MVQMAQREIREKMAHKWLKWLIGWDHKGANSKRYGM